MQDLKFALRLLLKFPGISLVAILSLALGIGANTTIFSFANALLLREPNAVARPDRLAEVWITDASGNAPAFGGLWGLSYLDYLEFRDHTHSFSSLALYDALVQPRARTGPGGGVALWTGQLVTANYFDVLGVAPALGRAFLPQEGAVKGSGNAVVLSYAAWQRRFGGDPGVIGRQITLNQMPFTVVGVAPQGFVGMLAGEAVDFWAPITTADRLGAPGLLDDRGNRAPLAIGRLAPGVILAGASAEMDAIQRGLDRRFPHFDDPNWGGRALPTGSVPSPARGFVNIGSGLLGAVVGLVLLIACANAALVLLVQALGRRREWAVRMAIGASRGRLIRQGLVHSVLLALIAGGAGVFVAQGLAPLLLRLVPPGLPFALNLPLDTHVLLFTLVVAVATGILFGLAPAWQSARVPLLENLKDGAPGSGTVRSGARSAFIVAQVALCMVVLVGGALCLRSLGHARAIDPGFDVQHTLIAQIDPQSLGYSGDAAHLFMDRVRSAVGALPGVRGATYTSFFPLQGQVNTINVLAPGMTPPKGEEGFTVDLTEVAPDYFRTTGTRLLRGRDFTAADLAPGHPTLVVINDTLARQFWPRGDALGQSLLFPGDKNYPTTRIVGVAATGKYRSLGEAPRPFVYVLRRLQSPAVLLVRVAGNADAFFAPVRQRLQALDPNLALGDMRTMPSAMQFPLFPARFSGLLLAGFGLLALLLAVVGLYGVIAAAVVQRTREYGIRIALGADAPALLRLVVGQGLRLALWGVLAGGVLAMLLTRFMAGLLYGMSPADPVSYLATAVILLAVAALASFLPARRATRTDPLRALRTE